MSGPRFALWYLGVGERRGQELESGKRSILATFWETIFQTLFLWPSYYVIQTRHVRWVTDPSLDQNLKVSVVVVNAFCFIYISLALHQVGGLRSEFMKARARRICRKMEAAWVWEDYATARDLAAQLLRVSRETWMLGGSPAARFYQALSLYVMSTDTERCAAERQRLLLESRRIAEDSGYLANDIVARNDLIPDHRQSSRLRTNTRPGSLG